MTERSTSKGCFREERYQKCETVRDKPRMSLMRDLGEMRVMPSFKQREGGGGEGRDAAWQCDAW